MKAIVIHSFGHRLHTYCSALLNSAFHPLWDGKLSIILWLRMLDLLQQTQRSNLRLGLRFGSHLALTNFHLDDSSKLSHMALPQLIVPVLLLWGCLKLCADGVLDTLYDDDDCD